MCDDDRGTPTIPTQTKHVPNSGVSRSRGAISPRGTQVFSSPGSPQLKYVSTVTVTPAGGIYSFLRLQACLYIPKGAVSTNTTLTIAWDATQDPKLPRWTSMFSKRFVLQSKDPNLKFNEPIYLLFSHSLSLPDCVQGSGLPTLLCKEELHGDCDQPWVIVGAKTPGEQLPHGFEHCPDKQGFITYDRCMVEMLTCCTFCLVSFRDAEGKEGLARRVDVLVYGEYQSQGGNLNIMVYVVHGVEGSAEVRPVRSHMITV